MDNNLQYEVSAEQEIHWPVGEEQEKYTHVLGHAIERYLEELRTIERQIAGGAYDDDAIHRKILVLNDTILKICAQFEQEVKDENVVKATRSYFRKRTNPILSKSYAINRLRT